MKRRQLDGFVKKWTWVSHYEKHHESVYMDLAKTFVPLLSVLDSALIEYEAWACFSCGNDTKEGHASDCPVRVCIEAGLSK